jgi:predicted flap endonuclease-1-like 5' DNA nuclease
VAGEVLSVPAHRELPGAGAAGPADDLAKLKGVGPKFVARLNELGITRYEQLAGFSDSELAHLDERLGPFRGRLARDRIAEQASYLARGDTEGFEERFGKLGG